jgi:RNA polymerase sigma-70 factor (ECF subfamily)
MGHHMARQQLDWFETELVAAIPAMTRYAKKLARRRDRVDDLVADALERGLRYRHQFERGTNLQAWMMTIIHNTWCEMVCRLSFRNEVLDADGMIAAHVAVKDDPLIKLQASEVVSAIEHMPEIWRDVVLARAVGDTDEDISTGLQIATGTVRSRLNRAREHLKEYA